MTGYEFTRFEADFTSKLKARNYDVKAVALKIKNNNPNIDFRAEEDYSDSKSWMVDTTMSCNLEEAISWMKYYMLNAIAYGIETKNLDWRTKFLAAYDIYNNLIVAN